MRRRRYWILCSIPKNGISEAISARYERSIEEASGEYRTYHYDRRGSTIALTDAKGQVTDRYTYGPYGETLKHEGNTDNPFQYNGRDGVMTDPNGLYYMRARYYQPEIKRFVNRDVLTGTISEASTLNRYAYVNGNPVSYVDPFGLSRDGDSSFLLQGATSSSIRCRGWARSKASSKHSWAPTS
ncbi:RHS repeat-associated core domain-containing protein [Paenibacillus ehimensis]|uniref:RHS repeat-associated core domain-containing protein n=1 Tax=Paenibacillus ehimensis TaxID=79264 RepID=UPI000A05A158|nr:RHS repeat-associated core domain-containing protein [Paenibacillus ehimensis]